MWCEGEVAVEKNSEVADVWAGRESGVIDGEAEVVEKVKSLAHIQFLCINVKSLFSPSILTHFN